MYSNSFVALVKLYRILTFEKIGYKLFLKRRSEKLFFGNKPTIQRT